LARRLRLGGRLLAKRDCVNVEFYRRLIDVLERHRLVRAPATTHREFALRAAEFLSAQPETQALAAVPHRVVDSFHRVRFGHESIAREHEAELLAAVSDLEARIEGANGSNGERSQSKSPR
jgi:hypothetical protein